MSASKGDVAAIWPDKPHAKGPGSGTQGHGAPGAGRGALTCCHLSCGYLRSASGTLAPSASGGESSCRGPSGGSFLTWQQNYLSS